MTTTKNDEIKLAVIQTDITYIKEKLTTIDTKVSSSYVSKEEYSSTLRRLNLLEKVVYGAIALILLAVGGAIVSSVVSR